MNRVIVATCVIVLFANALRAGEPEMPKPQKEHEWLQQLAGEWDTESEIFSAPGQPPAKAKGSESARMIGGFWSLSETKGDFGGPFTGILTLGYDPEKKEYIGTWVDSVTSRMWHYQGTLDAAGKILSLDTEGPDMEHPGTMAKFRETIEIKDKDHKVFTSMMEKDGKWITFLTARYERKK